MGTTFGLKYGTRFGTWNVRTLIEPTRLAQALKEMQEYRLAVLGLCETRWPDHGEFRSTDDSLLLYSGRPEGEARASGVGIILCKETKKSLLEWHPVSDRIITARLQARVRNITIVQCYAPTEPSTLEDKEAFYSALNATFTNIKKSDITILMGDFNAKVGNNNENVEHVMGHFGLGDRNVNGELLVDFCAAHRLVIGGTLFPHRDIHKSTWISPDQQTANQIDHVIISKRWRGSLLDVRSKRGADIGSDHHLVVRTV